VLSQSPEQTDTVKPMLFRKALLASAAASLGVAAPAAACDRHEPGQGGGFHRYNPFASALNTLGTSNTFKKDETVIIRRAKPKADEKAKKEDKRRQAALDAEAEEAKANEADLRERNRQGRVSYK